jgi:hypothetical protein
MRYPGRGKTASPTFESSLEIFRTKLRGVTARPMAKISIPAIHVVLDTYLRIGIGGDTDALCEGLLRTDAVLRTL